MTYIKAGRRSGFTMVELLIAIIIIGILTAIIVPVLSNRASDARIAAAKADMESIANAQSQVALDTGYIVRLHVLDDSGAPSDTFGSDDLLDVVDTIRDEDLNNGGFPDLIFLDAKTGNILPNTLFARVDLDPEKFGWRGPYINYHNKLDPESPPPATAQWSYGSPLDPWGAPYFLFVPGIDTVSGAPSDGRWMNEMTGTLDGIFDYAGASSDARQFDRFTLLSLGPNGLPGDGTPGAPLGTADDLVRAF